LRDQAALWIRGSRELFENTITSSQRDDRNALRRCNHAVLEDALIGCQCIDPGFTNGIEPLLQSALSRGRIFILPQSQGSGFVHHPAESQSAGTLSNSHAQITLPRCSSAADTQMPGKTPPRIHETKPDA
jgi:hypothetical protein